MQRFVLSDDSLVIVTAVDDVGEVTEHVTHICVRDDHQLVQRREKPPVGGVFLMQASRLFELLGVLLQLLPDARSGAAEKPAQEPDLIDRYLEGDGRAATRRVLVSHEEDASPCGQAARRVSARRVADLLWSPESYQ
ncbi:MAG: hypothetical protein QOF85_1007 [Solirubrobacterales bacterium]|jgi:hypothetical protein|nr:hypothetical protein [Solirubrobacterales bacterium]